MYKSRDSMIIPQSWQSSQFPPDFASQIQSGMLWSKPTTVETLWLGSTGSLRTLHPSATHTLYHNHYSICSLMVRYTLALRGQPKDPASEVSVQEQVVDIFREEQL